jgi:hypothetical protein
MAAKFNKIKFKKEQIDARIYDQMMSFCSRNEMESFNKLLVSNHRDPQQQLLFGLFRSIWFTKMQVETQMIHQQEEIKWLKYHVNELLK